MIHSTFPSFRYKFRIRGNNHHLRGAMVIIQHFGRGKSGLEFNRLSDSRKNLAKNNVRFFRNFLSLVPRQKKNFSVARYYVISLQKKNWCPKSLGTFSKNPKSKIFLIKISNIFLLLSHYTITGRLLHFQLSILNLQIGAITIVITYVHIIFLRKSQ
jgi:hypothetical protein